MEVTTVITFDLRTFRETSPKDSVVVYRNSLVRFELQNSRSGLSYFPDGSEFVVLFEHSPFKGYEAGFRRIIPRRHNFPISLGEDIADKEGEYKYSIGIQVSKKWEIEIDPILIVLPANQPNFYR